jgi:iron complex transport system ATP-binding protein
VIELKGVSVTLDGKPVLHGVDLSVEAGSWVSVIGPNGSGKTTLLRVVAGLVPCSGEVSISGVPAGSMARREISRTVAYLPQDPVLPPEMTVLEYVLLGRTPYIAYLGSESRTDRAVAGSVLEQTGLELFSRRRLGTLSGGELQRAIVARALAQEARILLLDEPTTGMDIGFQQQTLELVDSLRAALGLTVLSAIHDLTLAGQFSERLLLIDAGQVCAFGAPGSVLTEELLLKHYGVTVKILAGPGGRIAVIPLRSGGPSA